MLCLGVPLGLAHAGAVVSNASATLSSSADVLAVGAAIDATLAGISPAEQEQLLLAMACGRASEGSPLLAACAASADAGRSLVLYEGRALADSSSQRRELASSSSDTSGSSGDSGSCECSSSASGSGSGGGCPYHHHVPDGAVEQVHIELMGVVVILLTVLIEVGTHKLDHITFAYEHIFEMVQRVYKELMLLGIISFLLFLVESNLCLRPEITHEVHIIHLALFYISLAFILEAFFILFTAETVSKRWTRCERMKTMEYAKLKVQVSDMQQEWAQMTLPQRLCAWRLLFRLFDTQRSARYHDARNHFIKCNKLPVSFPFNKYLRRCVRHVFVELLHIHWGIWVSICMLLQLDMMIQTSFGKYADSEFEADEGAASSSSASSSSSSVASGSSSDGSYSSTSLETVDYFAIIGGILVLWLFVIYAKVVSVQYKCFQSDLLTFNVWEEILWMIQQQRLEESRMAMYAKRHKVGGLLQSNRDTAPYNRPARQPVETAVLKKLSYSGLKSVRAHSGSGAASRAGDAHAFSAQARKSATSGRRASGASTFAQLHRKSIGASNFASPAEFEMGRRTEEEIMSKLEDKVGGTPRKSCQQPNGRVSAPRKMSGNPPTWGADGAPPSAPPSPPPSPPTASEEPSKQRGTVAPAKAGGGHGGHRCTGSCLREHQMRRQGTHKKGAMKHGAAAAASQLDHAARARGETAAGLAVALLRPGSTGGHPLGAGLLPALEEALAPVRDRSSHGPLSEEELLERKRLHRQAVLAAWKYAYAGVMQEERRKQRDVSITEDGTFGLEQWGTTSRIFNEFFWFGSHHFIQSFLQGALFCSAMYFAFIVQFGPKYVFTEEVITERPYKVGVMVVMMAMVVFVGLLHLVPAILMRYTMVLHVAQLQDVEVVRHSVFECQQERNVWQEVLHGGHGHGHGGGHDAGAEQSLSRPSLSFSESASTSGARRISETSHPSYPGGGAYGEGEEEGSEAAAGGEAADGSCRNPLRPISDFLDRPEVVKLSLFLIMVNFFLVVLTAVVRDGGDDETARHLAYTDIGFAYLFVLEVFFRGAGKPREFLHSPWDIIDAVVVISYALITTLLNAKLISAEELSALVIARIMRLARFHRFVQAMKRTESAHLHEQDAAAAAAAFAAATATGAKPGEPGSASRAGSASTDLVAAHAYQSSAALRAKDDQIEQGKVRSELYYSGAAAQQTAGGQAPLASSANGEATASSGALGTLEA